MIKNDFMRTFLYQAYGDDPRYKNFLSAQNINSDYVRGTTKYSKLLEQHRPRLMQYDFYWNMYLGNHWQMTSYDYTELEEGTKKNVINYCNAVVNKHTAFLMNKGFLNESVYPEIEQYLQKNWKTNFGGIKDNNLFGIEMSHQGGITGDCFVEMLSSVDEFTGESFVKYKVLDSRKSFPIYDNNKKMIAFLYYGTEKRIRNMNNGFVEYDQTFSGFYYEPGKKTFIENEKVVNEQTFGILDIPIVHIKNFPVSIGNFGLSDLLTIGELNQIYDDLNSNANDILDYHASPITVLKGARGSDLVKGANRVWSLPKDSSIENLSLNGDLTALDTHMKRIRENIAEVSNVPEATIGKLQSVANTSGSALAITFMPLFETMELKRIVYGQKIMEMNKYLLKIAFLKGELSPATIMTNALTKWDREFGNYDDETKQQFFPFQTPIDIENIGNYDSMSAVLLKQIPAELYETFLTWYQPLPRDESITSNLALSNIQAGLWSKRYARSIIGMSEKESIMMEQEITKEKLADAELMGATNQLSMPQDQGVADAQTTIAGNPEVVSENNSTTNNGENA